MALVTDEEALQTLQSLKLTTGRGNSKTVFDGIVFEALSHAYEALKEKVNKGDLADD